MTIKFTSEFLGTQNKAQLRDLCRDNGISYNGLNVDGMRVALALVEDQPAQPEAPATEVTADTVVPQELRDAPAPVEAPVAVVPAVLPPVAPAAPAKAPKERKIQANRPERNGVKRPSEGTICAQIWAHCDKVLDETGAHIAAKDLRAALPALDDTTKTVQYYRWRKFNGIGK
jgi:hypothetical protein